MIKRVCLITGGSNGIGKELVESFKNNNYEVVFCDKNETDGKEVAKVINADFVKCDVSKEESLIELVKYIYEKYNRLDVIINNAGLSWFKPLLEVSVEEWDYILNTNLRSIFILAKEFAKNHKADTRGTIINISSTRSIMSEPNSEAYAASKGGINALTHSLAVSLQDYNITVNCVAPGWIQTSGYDELTELDHKQHPSNRVGKSQDIASMCLFLADEKNDFINGQLFVVDGGMTKKMIYV